MKINYYQPLRKGLVCEKQEGVGRERGMMLKPFSPGLKKEQEKYFRQMWYPLLRQPKYCKNAKWRLTKIAHPRNFQKYEEDVF